MKYCRVGVDRSRCVNCGFCSSVSVCYSPSYCVGCLACYWACPHGARVVEYMDIQPKMVKITVDGIEHEVPSHITLSRALEYVGFKFSAPGSRGVSLTCNTGGCWSCAVYVNGQLTRTCITPVESGMVIDTDVEEAEPYRIIHGPEPHRVGGKGTPWWEVDYSGYVEVAIWAAGCNLRCPQCQNYHVTYDNSSVAISPREAAVEVVLYQSSYNTKGIAISGGEPTLNRRWLLEFFKEVSRRVRPGVRRHLDSNGTLLTPDYIDELVASGCNNMGIEPKCLEPDTYMKITGISDRSLAVKYLGTAWRAIEYVYERYVDKVYLGVGLVYNRALVSLDEIAKAGEKIVSIDPGLQVTVLDYFPAFRRRYLKRPTVDEMLLVKKTLEDRGLKCVIVQTEIGHIGPGKHLR